MGPGGTSENSPAIHRWDQGFDARSSQGGQVLVREADLEQAESILGAVDNGSVIGVMLRTTGAKARILARRVWLLAIFIRGRCVLGSFGGGLAKRCVLLLKVPRPFGLWTDRKIRRAIGC